MQRGSTTSYYIKAMFESCCWKSLDSVRINVEVEPGRVLKLHRLRIKERRHAIARMMLQVRKDMHRSVNPKGMPWRAARILDDKYEIDEQTAELLLALGAAAGFVTIAHRKVESLDNWVQHFAVIEDVIIENWLAAEKRDKRQEKTPSNSPSMGRTSDIAGEGKYIHKMINHKKKKE